ncbi:HdeD family acid-resistance protein [Blastococcus sp. SYSU D01042]
MTASAPASYAPSNPRRHAGARIVVALLGLATFVLGVVLLANPVRAANALALLVGIAFVVGGLLEIAVGWDVGPRWAAVVLGGILVGGGVLAMAWPDVTLWVVAAVTGLSLIAHGVGRVVLALALRRQVDGWVWGALAGAFGIFFGLLALVWPQATVLVLCLVLGAQVAAIGMFVTAAAFLPVRSRSRVPAPDGSPT